MISRIKGKIDNLLTWGEQYFNLDVKYLVSGSFWTIFGEMLNDSFLFFLIIAFANLLPKETYGIYSYILSLANLFAVFTLTGMNIAVSQAVANGYENALKLSVRYQFKWNIGASLAFFAAGFYYLINQNIAFAASLFILGVFFPATTALNTYGAFLGGKKEFKTRNIWSAISIGIYVIGMILTMFLTQDVVFLILAYALLTFSTNLFFYIRTIRLFKPKPDSDGDAIKYGRHLTFSQIISPVVSQIDKIVLNYFWGPVALASYSLATAIPEKISAFTKDIIYIGAPKLAVRTKNEISQTFNKRLFQTASLGLVFAVFFITLSPFIFKYVLPKYLESVFYSQLLALGLLFYAPYVYIGTVFLSQKMIRQVAINSVSMSIVRLLLYIILGIWGGILGLIVAQLLYYIIGLALVFFLWRYNVTKIAPAKV